MFEAYRSCVPRGHVPTVLKASERPRDTLSKRIKNIVTVLELVSQYVDLEPTSSGAIGLCPFHDDHKPSLGINDIDNYWHCFAGCGGGSVVDFWMKWRDCNFTAAIAELSHILL